MAFADITVVGGLLLDLNFFVKSWPKPGRIVNASDFYIQPGGKGLIQATTASILEIKSAIIGKIGDDDFGNILTDLLDTYGVYRQDCLIVDPSLHTGVACMLAEDNRFPGYIGATLAAESLTVDEVRAVSRLIEESKVIIANFDVGPKIARVALEIASKNSAQVIKILDAAIFNESVDQEQLKGFSKVVDYIIVENQQACAVLYGEERQVSDKELAKNIHDLGFKNVFITNGFEGGVFVSAKETIPFKALPNTEIYDTTGAKEVFTASFAVACVRNLPLRDAIRYANIAGGQVPKRVGVIHSIPNQPTIDSISRQLTRSNFEMFEA